MVDIIGMFYHWSCHGIQCKESRVSVRYEDSRICPVFDCFDSGWSLCILGCGGIYHADDVRHCIVCITIFLCDMMREILKGDS